MIVVCNTVVNPGTMTAVVSFDIQHEQFEDSLIGLRNTALAALTVLTPKRLAYHAANTKMVLIKLSRVHKFINNRFRCASTG